MFTSITTAEPATVLIVDDEPYLRSLVARWLNARGYRTFQAGTATEALRCLDEFDVHLATFDISMPGESGLDLLAKVRVSHPELPVLMLTASGHTKTAIEAMVAGACGYLIKPIQEEELLVQVARGLQWGQLWLERQAYTRSLEEKVAEQTRVIRHAHEETIHRLVAATMCRDEETGAHIMRTGLFSEALASGLDWSAAEIERLGFAAPMHDIGKVGIPDAILQKPGRLTPDEFEVMKTHTTFGSVILKGSQSPVLQLAREIALCHHERWDGKGYPAGLAGEAIPIAARIVSIVDVYDALTHDRIYRPAFPEHEALAMMQSQQGAQFDPLLLSVFFSILEEIHDIALRNPDGANAPVSGAPTAMSSVNLLPSMNLTVNV